MAGMASCVTREDDGREGVKMPGVTHSGHRVILATCALTTMIAGIVVVMMTMIIDCTVAAAG
jgi:hypothetical protein